MLRGYFFAFPPEVNSARLSSGPGPAHLDTTAAAYAGMASALNLAADGSDGSTSEMSVTWEGATSSSAQAAFRRHAAWLRQQAAIATDASALAEGGATAYRTALSAMPPLAAIQANRAHAAELAAEAAVTSNTGLGLFTAAKIMLNEAIYMAMWVQAASTMMAYDAAASGLIATLGTLQPPPPPPITSVGAVGPSGGPGISAAPGAGPSEGWSGGSTSGSSGGGSSPGGDGAGPQTTETPSSGETPNDMVQNPAAEQGLTDVEQAMSSMNDSLADPGAGDLQSGMPEQQGFYGTSPYSPTLAGLSGGMGSMVALGMVRGGLGSMSGAATGFRMPANWTPAAGRAFGAGTGMAPAASGGAPRRGVSAPAARMQRRRKDDENKPAKVFAPGEQQDVPELERPPEIGVIEYVDDTDQREDDTVSEALLAGVLERFDLEDAEDNDDARRDTQSRR